MFDPFPHQLKRDSCIINSREKKRSLPAACKRGKRALALVARCHRRPATMMMAGGGGSGVAAAAPAASSRGS